MAFEKNLETAFGIEGGKSADVQSGSKATKTAYDETADIRDILSGLVGNGVKDFSNPDTKKYYAALTGLVGTKQAQQMLTHIFEFNQRDDAATKNPEQRIRSFYDLGSKDADIDNILKGVKSFGYGVMDGARTSADILNRRATGRDDLSGGTNNNTDKIKSIADNTIKN